MYIQATQLNSTQFKQLDLLTSPVLRTDLCRWPLPKATRTSCLHWTHSSLAATQPAALVAWDGHSRPDAAVHTLRACMAAMPCSSRSSAAVRVSALVQTYRQMGCHASCAAHVLLLWKQDWLSKGDKSCLQQPFMHTLLACLLSTTCSDTIGMARYGILQQAHRAVTCLTEWMASCLRNL